MTSGCTSALCSLSPRKKIVGGFDEVDSERVEETTEKGRMGREGGESLLTWESGEGGTCLGSGCHVPDRYREVRTLYLVGKFSRCHASLPGQPGPHSRPTRIWRLQLALPPAPNTTMPPRLTIRGAWRSLPLTLRSRPLAQAQQQLQQLQQPSIAVAVFARQFTDDAATPQYRGPTPAAAAGESTLPTLPASMMRPGESPPPPLPSPRELREIREEEVRMQELTANEQAVHQLQQAAYSQYSGLTFEEPPMPQDKLKMAKYHMRYRYDEGISQLTKLLMRDGKLSKAQNVSTVPINLLLPDSSTPTPG